LVCDINGRTPNRVLRRIFGSKMEEIIGVGENFIVRSVITYIVECVVFAHQVQRNAAFRKVSLFRP
jgi:hypothetical protein